MENVEQEIFTPSLPVVQAGFTAGLPVAALTAHPDVVCSKCRWNCARRSRRRTSLDLLLTLFFLAPYRCRSCRKRYYRLAF